MRRMSRRTIWLDELGLKPAATREEWQTLCEKMTNPQKKRYGYAFRGSRGGFWSWWAMAEEWAGTNDTCPDLHRVQDITA